MARHIMESPDVMNLKQATVLITGGTQGIGLGLAERFLALGSSVIVTGRDPRRIDHTIHALPGLHGWVSDISSPEDRISLAQRIESEFPAINSDQQCWYPKTHLSRFRLLCLV